MIFVLILPGGVDGGAAVSASFGKTLDRWGTLFTRAKLEFDQMCSPEARASLKKFMDSYSIPYKNRTCDLLRIPDEPLTDLRFLVRKIFPRKSGGYVFTGFVFEVPK